MSTKQTYPFKDDDGKIYKLTFAQVLESQDGFYEHPNGKMLRRCATGNVKSTARVDERKEIISDSLGFPKRQLKEMQAHLELTGCRGVEFVQDKTEETFVQVKMDGPQAKAAYMKARGFSDHNSRNGSGAMLSELDLENAKELVLRNHG